MRESNSRKQTQKLLSYHWTNLEQLSVTSVGCMGIGPTSLDVRDRRIALMLTARIFIVDGTGLEPASFVLKARCVARTPTLLMEYRTSV